MELLSRKLRRRLAAGLLLPAVLGAGCVDERAPTATSSTFLDGDALFGVSLLTSSILRYQNEMAERVLDIVRNDTITPIFESAGCAGEGERVFTRDNQNANRLTIQHTSVVIDCDGLTLILNGKMTIEVLESSPGIHYRMVMPLNQATGQPEGMIYQTPSDFANGAIFYATTPGVTLDPSLDPYGSGGYLDCVLSDGSIEQVGTFRLEERVQGILVVEEMDVRYAYDEGISPPFADWPGGQLQVAGIGSQGFGAQLSTPPVDILFDGIGGATFEVSGRTCQSNMATGTNPCESL